MLVIYRAEFQYKKERDKEELSLPDILPPLLSLPHSFTPFFANASNSSPQTVRACNQVTHHNSHLSFQAAS